MSDERTRIEGMFAGVDQPEQMGTSGLAAWVCCGGRMKHTWNRYRRARSIIRKRLGDASASRFCAACKTVTANLSYGERIDGYEKTIAAK